MKLPTYTLNLSNYYHYLLLEEEVLAIPPKYQIVFELGYENIYFHKSPIQKPPTNTKFF